MKHWELAVVGVASVATAAGPTTQPLKPQPFAVPRNAPALIDASRPSFVPKFAKAENTLAGPVAERNYAYRNTYPGLIYSGYGFYGGGYFGHGAGTWGSTQIQFR